MSTQEQTQEWRCGYACATTYRDTTVSNPYDLNTRRWCEWHNGYAAGLATIQAQELTEQETDLPRNLMDEVMRDLQAANLYFIVDRAAVPNYRYCKPDAPIYIYRIGAWRQV